MTLKFIALVYFDLWTRVQKLSDWRQHFALVAPVDSNVDLALGLKRGGNVTARLGSCFNAAGRGARSEARARPILGERRSPPLRLTHSIHRLPPHLRNAPLKHKLACR